MQNTPLNGALYLLKGARLVTTPGLRRYVIIPLLINITLFVTMIVLVVGQAYTWSLALLPGWLDWLTWLIVPLLGLAVMVVMALAFNLLANLIASPFNGLLAEAVERHLTGRAIDGGGGIKGMVADLWLTLRSEARKLAYIIVRGLPLLLVLFVPVIGPLLWMLFGAWMLAISYLDYPMGNHQISFSEQRARLGERRMLALGFGGAVMAAITIPFLNFLVIPCAVAGATALWVERLSEQRLGSQVSG